MDRPSYSLRIHACIYLVTRYILVTDPKLEDMTLPASMHPFLLGFIKKFYIQP